MTDLNGMALLVQERGGTRLAVVSLAILALGCGRDAPPGPAVTVVDSVGIEIVTSRGQGWTLDDAWRLEGEPVLLGGHAPGEELFGVRSVARLPDGGIAVLSAGNHQVVIFDAEGRRLRSFGRQGEGPGELMAPGSMAFRAPDTLMVHDPALLRVSFFDLDGATLGTESAELVRDAFGEGTAVQPTIVLPDRTFFGMALRRSEQRAPTPSGVYRPGTGYALVPTGTGDPVLLGYYPGIEQERLDMGGGQRNVVAPFARSTLFATHPWPDPVYLISDTEAYSVEVFGADGVLTRMVRRDVDPVAVRPEWIEAWKDAQRGMSWTRGQLDQLEIAWNRMTARETLPALAGMAMDSLGHLWVIRPTGLPRDEIPVDVFDPAGRFQGSLTVPAGLRWVPTPIIGADYFLGVWADELDVETVRIYPLERGR